MAAPEVEVSGGLLSPENVADPCPYFAALRSGDPAHWEEGLNGWLLTRYEDVQNGYRDSRLTADFVKEIIPQQLKGHDPDIAKDCVRLNSVSMMAHEGGEHARLRKQASPAFTVTVVDRWRPVVREIVDGLLDAVADRGELDVVADLAGPMAATVVTRLLGVPGEDQGDLQRWSDESAPFFGGAVGDLEAAARIANDRYLRLEAYLLPLIEERTARPADDIISVLIAHQHEGHMTHDELVGNVIFMLAAGNVTTMDLFANGVHTLLTHPDQLERLRTEPGLRRSAVEEMLRYCPSVQLSTRLAAADVELHGKVIKAGQMVHFAIASANRDPEVFAEPDRFDVARSPNRPLSFGFGPHVCLGAALARREVEIGLELLLERMPGLALDPDRPPVAKTESLMFRGYHRLPVRF